MLFVPGVHRGLQEKEAKLQTAWLVTSDEAIQNERAGVFGELHHLGIQLVFG